MWWVLLIAACAAIKYWTVVAFLGFWYSVAKAVEYGFTTRKRRKAARRKAERRLIRNADREHRLIQQGSSAGIYGDWPIPKECRGVGVWLTEE